MSPRAKARRPLLHYYCRFLAIYPHSIPAKIPARSRDRLSGCRIPASDSRHELLDAHRYRFMPSALIRRAGVYIRELRRRDDADFGANFAANSIASFLADSDARRLARFIGGRAG